MHIMVLLNSAKTETRKEKQELAVSNQKQYSRDNYIKSRDKEVFVEKPQI